MAEYLELEKVLDDNNIITVQTREYGTIEIILVDTITDIELADAQPIRRGRWIFTEKLILGNPYGSYKCSECCYHVPHEDNYCPNCGADMRELNEEEMR